MASAGTLAEHLAGRAERVPEELAVRFLRGAAPTNAGLWGESLRSAAVLADAGVKTGDRVAIMCGNRLEFLTGFLGAILTGGLPVPVNTAYRGDSLDHVLRDAEPRVLLLEDVHRPVVEASLERVPVQPTVLSVDGEFADAIGAADPSSPAVARRSDPMAILYTSGTTGRSKGVLWSHGMLGAFMDSAELVLGLRPDDISFGCLPLFHANALFATVFSTFRAGGLPVISERFSASAYWDEVRDADASVISLLGAMIPILWNNPRSPADREHRVRVALAAPAPRAAHREEYERRFGFVTTEVYGSTDVGMALGVPFGERAPSGSCGRPLPGWEAAVVDDEDERVDAGKVGTLVLRPTRPFRTQLEYWRQPDVTVAAWRNFWFHTGDLVIADADGWVSFVDRAKDCIRRSGENISSFEIELVLASHPAIAEVAAFPVPADLVEDEVMVAIRLEVEEDASLDVHDLLEFCAERLPYFAIPRYVEFVDALPKTENEKVRKDALRAIGVNAATYDRGRGRYSRQTSLEVNGQAASNAHPANTSRVEQQDDTTDGGLTNAVKGNDSKFPPEFRLTKSSRKKNG